MGDHADALRPLARRDDFPALHRALDVGAVTVDDLDEEFGSGPARLLDGLAALVHVRSLAAPAEGTPDRGEAAPAAVGRARGEPAGSCPRS